MQADELKDIFEEVNGLKDCLQRCVTGMEGKFKKSQISRQLKAMGLKRNRLTDNQVSDPNRAGYLPNTGRVECAAVI